MSALAMMRRGLRSLGPVTSLDARPARGLVPHVVETGVGAITSYALGQAHVEFRDSENFFKKHTKKIVAVAGKAAALIAGHYAGDGYIASSFNAAGQAAVNAIALEKGIQDGMARTRREVAITPPGVKFDKLPPGTIRGERIGEHADEMIGEIPQAAPGTRWLGKAAIDEINAMH